MRAIDLLWAGALLGHLAAPAAAVDLAKIDRSIRKEPVYQSKEPQYCLLVFGPEAKVRVWLVLDGDALYLDRNGDLTEPGKRIEPSAALAQSTRTARDEDRPGLHPFASFKDGKREGELILS